LIAIATGRLRALRAGQHASCLGATDKRASIMAPGQQPRWPRLPRRWKC